MGLGKAAELGCKSKPEAAGGAAGESGAGIRLESRLARSAGLVFFGERDSGLGNVDCVGVRAGLREGSVGVAGSPFG